MFGEHALGATGFRIPGIAQDRPLDLSIKAVQEKLSPAANRAFFSVATHWKLRDEDARNLLGGISNGSFYQLKRSVSKTLDQDKLTRISLLVGLAATLVRPGYANWESAFGRQDLERAIAAHLDC